MARARSFSDTLLYVPDCHIDMGELMDSSNLRLVSKKTFWDLEFADEDKIDTDIDSDGDVESLIDLASDEEDLGGEDWSASDDGIMHHDIYGSDQWMSCWQTPADSQDSLRAQTSERVAGESKMDLKTTISMTNVPMHCSTAALSQALNANGLQGCYDFVYVPSCREAQSSLGFAVVNMVSPQAAEMAMRWLEGCKVLDAEPGLSVCRHEEQGFDAIIRRLCPSDLHQVSSDWHPMFFDRRGARLSFPSSLEQ